MEHSETRAGFEQIAVGVIGTGGMHAENLHSRVVAAEGCVASLREGLPPTERPVLHGNEGLRVIR